MGPPTRRGGDAARVDAYVVGPAWSRRVGSDGVAATGPPGQARKACLQDTVSTTADRPPPQGAGAVLRGASNVLAGSPAETARHSRGVGRGRRRGNGEPLFLARKGSSRTGWPGGARAAHDGYALLLTSPARRPRRPRRCCVAGTCRDDLLRGAAAILEAMVAAAAAAAGDGADRAGASRRPGAFRTATAIAADGGRRARS